MNKFLAILIVALTICCIDTPAAASPISTSTPTSVSVKSTGTKTVFVAHRGFLLVEPENTMQAVKAAGKYGFGMVEVDPRITKNNVWVLMHDISIDRTTTGHGLVASLTYAKIERYYIKKTKYKVPSLTSIVKECSKLHMGINIDGSKFTVNKKNIQYVYNLLKKYNLISKSCIACRETAGRQIIFKYAPGVRIVWLSKPENYKDDMIESQKYNNDTALAYSSTTSSDTLTPDIIKKLHAKKIRVYMTTVTTEDEALKWSKMGVDYIETSTVKPIN